MGRGSWHIKNKKNSTQHVCLRRSQLYKHLPSFTTLDFFRTAFFFFREQEFWGHKFSSSLKCLISGFQAFVSVRGPLDSTKGTYTSGQGLGLGLEGAGGVPLQKVGWVRVVPVSAGDHEWGWLDGNQVGWRTVQLATPRLLLTGSSCRDTEALRVRAFISIFSCRCHFLFFSIFGLHLGDRNETNLATKNNQSWQ